MGSSAARNLLGDRNTVNSSNSNGGMYIFFSKNREKELTVLKEELFSRSALITYIDEFVPKV